MFFVSVCQVGPERFQISDISVANNTQITFSLVYSLSLSLEAS